MSKTGTKEWAETTCNLYVGCEHDCSYCYGRELALRYGWIKTPEEWSEMKLKKSLPSVKKYPGRVMFPSIHDILPDNLEVVIPFLKGLLEKGNEVLIVTKPHYDCISILCRELKEFKDKIMFRFTIGSVYDKVLKFWEPNAPDYHDRFMSLRYAYHKGFATSVSCEPYLDDDIFELVEDVAPYITDTIWIGKMNKIRSRVKIDSDEIEDAVKQIEKICTDEFILQLYDRFQDTRFQEVTSKVRWKDSCRRVLEKHGRL